MRITDMEQKIMSNAISDIDADAKVWLFGSRVFDDKKGGDIDIAIQSSKIDLMKKIKIRRAIADAIGEQKIDIIVSKNGAEPFFKLAQETGVRIDEL
jgi:predicted nucleotidyltransferase